MTTSPASTAAPTLELSDLPEADQLAVLHTLGTLQQGFAERNADRLVDVYSDDADWVNAFGTSKHGVHDIVDYLSGLFADDNFNAGTVVKGPDISMRVLTRDVIVVSAHLVVDGQGLVDGGTLHRDNFSVRVLQRHADGRWPIVSEMFMDANTETTYEKGMAD
jgi:uncharacterized protein (TIGR02246 family)